MKAAVLGCGKNGQTKIAHLMKSALIDEVVACDPNPDRLAEVVARYPVRTVSNAYQVVNDPTIELVLVSTPNDTHAELTIAALHAGKAVLCEKPMANTLSEAAAMVRAADETGGFLHVGFELRYSTLYTTVKRWTDAGLLGDVVNTHCLYVSSEYFGKDTWRVRSDTCGDMFGEKLSHYVDLPRWWIGSPVRDVFAVSAPNVVPYFEINDSYHATYRFENGAVSQLTFMMSHAATFRGDPLQDTFEERRSSGHELRFIISGTHGAAETDVFGRSIKRWEFGADDHGLTSDLVEDLTWPAENDHEYFHNTLDQTLDVVQRVACGRPPSLDPHDALETTMLCIGAEQSARTGSLVALEDLPGGKEPHDTH